MQEAVTFQQFYARTCSVDSYYVWYVPQKFYFQNTVYSVKNEGWKLSNSVIKTIELYTLCFQKQKHVVRKDRCDIEYTQHI